MLFNKTKSIKNIKTKVISKTFNSLDNGSLKISILDAKYGENQGEEILLDENILNRMMDNIFKSVYNNTSKYNTFPKSIVISQDEALLQTILEKENTVDDYRKENCEIINIYTPKYNFDSVYIKKEAKQQILGGLTIIKNKDKLFKDWGLSNSIKTNRALVFNFYGPPGTGKSMMAEAIANYLGKRVFSVNYSQLESKYVGETPKNIKKVFEIAKNEDSVLILDEADSFLGKRLKNISQSADYGVNITRSVMLLELEKFDGIVIFTTNLLDNYDDAFKRRILANVEFNLPDEAGREMIWSTHIPKEFPISKDISISMLARKYENVSGADIKDIVLYAGVNAIQDGREVIIEKDFDLAYKYIISRYISNETKFENINIKTTRMNEEEYQKFIRNEGE